MTQPVQTLIVDDDEGIRFFLASTLQKLGHNVTTADCGEKALELLRDTPLDLSILDLQLGGRVDGLRVLEAIKWRWPDAATIILTGLFPRPQNRDLALAIEQVNRRIQRLADGRRIRFININDQLTDASGRLLPGISSDGLHLEEPGYEVWARVLNPIFTELLGPPAAEDRAPPPTGDPSAAR